LSRTDEVEFGKQIHFVKQKR